MSARKRRAIRKQRRRRERRADARFRQGVERAFAPYAAMFSADFARFIGGSP